LTASEKSIIAEGRELYQQVCAGCHGVHGEGVRPVAPPLDNSEWVTESADRLIRIALHGVQGAMHVDGKLYQPPEVLPEMLPLDVLDDIQLAAILSYVRNDWGHVASPISVDQIQSVRNETKSRALPWTETELLKIK
jgi:mono/diheme cytochrome c family protein